MAFGEGAGGGGEYEAQVGFGWSNGVILSMLERYGGGMSLKQWDAHVASERAEKNKPPQPRA